MAENNCKTWMGLGEWIEARVNEWNVPGLAVAVVEKDKVLYRSGFGYRDIENKLPVDTDTIFGIGSSSKPFAATWLAMLVEEGILDWDKPIKEYLPNFRMHDALVTEKITFRDIICHRTGMPNHQLLLVNPSLSGREQVDRLNYLETNEDFRKTWQYSNIMYAMIGYLVESITNITWEEWTQKRLLTPLGMRNTYLTLEEAQQTENYALPYAALDGQNFPLPFSTDIAGTAGAMLSSVEDLAKWISFQLNQGIVEGNRLISQESLAETHFPNMISGPGKFPEIPFSTYGLGWFIDIFRGHRMIHHSGSIDGFYAHMSFMPDDNIGIVAVVNRESTLLPDCIAYHIYDEWLGEGHVDWNERFKKKQQELENMMMEASELEPSTEKPEPASLSLEDYTGVYEHPAYEKIEITQNGDDLNMIFRTFSWGLTHAHKDVFLSEAGLPVTFSVNPDGSVRSLQIPLEPTVQEIVFLRKKAKEPLT